MKIISEVNEKRNESIYTVELEPGVSVDVKRVENYYYIMQCGDGYEVFDDNGNTFDYSFDREKVLDFVGEVERLGSFK